MTAARLRELDPLDDPFTDACDALEDDSEFCAAFLAEHWGDVIALIVGPDFNPTLRLAERRALRAKLYAAERDELNARRDV